MKKLSYLLTLLLLVTLMTGCKAFHTLMDSKLKTAQGAPYELIVVCNQQLWESELGDTLRSVLLAPIPYLNEREPLFNVMQFPESGFKGTVVDYRNILKVLVDPSLAAASAGVQYDVTASPQVVVTLQGPTREALTQYVAEHRAELVQTFEGAERDRSIAFANKFNQTESGKLVREKFGVEMKIPKGYILAQQSDDFLWFRYEFPAASQGFMLYSYPYEGKQSLSEEALLAARNRFAARIPGPSDGSYMTTSKVFTPRYRFFRLEGRAWVEMRGFWDGAERDRSIAFANKFNQTESGKLVREKFGVEMKIPKGYILAQQSDDFLWFRYEFPAASQGFMLYSYPYEGKQSLSEEALLAARNRFAARIPGPSDGSYMTTSKVFTPRYRFFRLEGRAWVEMRGFWDVEGDFMGGPFVSYTTVDTATDRVFTLDCYVYSPKLPKRNYMREVEHLLHLVKFPAATGSASATVTAGRREAAKSDAPASRDANPKPEAISSES